MAYCIICKRQPLSLLLSIINCPGKACEMFIHELTMRAWVHTEDNKRRTLQRNDIAMAITKYDQFDFLIDIVPRDDIKPAAR